MMAKLMNILKTIRHTSLALMLLAPMLAAAFSLENLPESFEIRNVKDCSRCIKLLHNDLEVGSLTKQPNAAGTYDYFDEDHNKALTLKIKSTRTNVFIDILDKKNNLVAQMLYDSDMSFVLYTADRKDVLISGGRTQGISRFTGMHHTIYRARSWDVLAELTRPLFSFSHDSKVKITNKDMLLSGNIDPNVFAAALSFYSIDGYINEDHKYHKYMDKTFRVFKTEAEKVTNLAKYLDVDNKTFIQDSDIHKAENVLMKRYNEVYGNDEILEVKQIKQYINFACDLIESHQFSAAEEKAMLKLLLNRLAFLENL
jgi:hypothetical protein